MIHSVSNMPNYIRREIGKLEEMIEPSLRKSSKYVLWSLPLIFISMVNLVALLFVVEGNQNLIILMLLYAVIGAVGMALSKEAKLQQKEVQKKSLQYIEERILSSAAASESLKNKYVSLVKQQPGQAVLHFIKFLEEEESKYSYY